MEQMVIIIYQWQFESLLRRTVDGEVNILEWIKAEWMNEQLEQTVEKLYPYYRGMNKGNVITCVMVSSRKLKEIIMRMLQAFEVDESQILDVYKAYLAGFPRLRYQRIMERKKNVFFDGLILGISHGMTGIIEEKMPGVVCNLCESSQDIYFNYRVLRGIEEEYHTQVSNLKYVVIDMFDYNYFNFDTIQTGAYAPFLEESGFECEMREPWNKEENVNQINERLWNMWREGEDSRDMLYNLFPQIGELDECVYKGYTVVKERKHIIAEEEIVNYRESGCLSSIQLKVFEQTIQFQIANFEKLLILLYGINPRIKIWLLLMPKYVVVEEMESHINETWKKVFMGIIENLRKRYPTLQLLDWKGCKEFSANRENYFDMTHFNYQGACRFTEYLAENIQLM